MKTVPLYFVSILGIAQAQSLSFTSGSVSDAHAVTLTFQGPTNRVIYVERLKYDTQTWQIVATNTLNFAGQGTNATSLDGNFYGIFRCRTTNNSHYSVNGFGAVAGYLPQGYTIVGNPFNTNNVSQMIRQPNDPLATFVWRSGTYQDGGTYSGGTWINPVDLASLEAVIVYNSSTNSQHYIASGVFTTNSFSRSLSACNLTVSPLFRIQSPNTNTLAKLQPYFGQPVDTLTNGLLGGNSQFPVPISSFYTNGLTLSQVTNTMTPTYQSASLPWNGTNWLRGGTVVTPRPNLSEGFWFCVPTNRTWTIPARPIWP